MRNAELSTPSPSGDSSGQTQLLLSKIDSLVKKAENDLTPSDLTTAEADLRISLTQLSKLTPFPTYTNVQLWKLSHRLWNATIDLFNTTTSSRVDLNLRAIIASHRQVAAELLSLAGPPPGVPSPAIKCASFYYKTGKAWREARRYNDTLACLRKATDLVSSVVDADEHGGRRLLLDLHLDSARTAWELSDFYLAFSLLARAKKFLFGCVEHYKNLASLYLIFGRYAVENRGDLALDGAEEGLKLMNEALELCETGASGTGDEALDLKMSRSEVLRFIATFHLQLGEFESVIKVLRGGEGGGDDHPSSSVLAVKGWLGMGKYGEAEKELKAMVANEGIPEGIWVSAIEAYFQMAGVAGAQTLKDVFRGRLEKCHVRAAFAQTLKEVFLGRLEKCQVRAAFAVWFVHRLIGDHSRGNLEGSDVRVKVVAELVSEDRVLSLFNGDEKAEDRTTLHSLLWNCAADHFRLKQYEISAEIFEKSMRYVSMTSENRSLQSESYRVLSLCHFHLSQLNQANGYLDLAEKMGANCHDFSSPTPMQLDYHLPEELLSTDHYDMIFEGIFESDIGNQGDHIAPDVEELLPVIFRSQLNEDVPLPIMFLLNVGIYFARYFMKLNRWAAQRFPHHNGFTIVISVWFEIVSFIFEYLIEKKERKGLELAQRWVFYTGAGVSLFLMAMRLYIKAIEYSHLGWGYHSNQYKLLWLFEKEYPHRKFGNVVAAGSMLGAVVQIFLIFYKMCRGFEAWLPGVVSNFPSMTVIFEIFEWLFKKLNAFEPLPNNDVPPVNSLDHIPNNDVPTDDGNARGGNQDLAIEIVDDKGPVQLRGGADDSCHSDFGSVDFDSAYFYSSVSFTGTNSDNNPKSGSTEEEPAKGKQIERWSRSAIKKEGEFMTRAAHGAFKSHQD